MLNPTGFSAQEQGILKKAAVFLTAVVLFYFIFKPFRFGRREETTPEKKIFPEKNDGPVSLSGLKSPPEGFILKIAANERFSFCYPKGWQLVKPSDPALYAEAKEQKTIPGTDFYRNFNISFQDISRLKDIDFLFRAIIEGVMNMLTHSQLEYKKPFKENGFMGVRYKINYDSGNGLRLSCYQVAVTTLKKRYLLIYTFTAPTGDFKNSVGLFDQIVGMVNIFD